jgi:hypothetical protein
MARHRPPKGAAAAQRIHFPKPFEHAHPPVRKALLVNQVISVRLWARHKGP